MTLNISPIPKVDPEIRGIARYRFFRDFIETGDIIEFASAGILGRLIRWKTGCKVNHTSMAFRYVLDGDNEPRITISEAVNDGVQPHFLSSELDGYDGQVYLVKLYPIHAGSRLKIAKAMQALEGVKYDFLNLFRNLGGPVRVGSDRLFCSEAVHVALINAGMLPTDFNSGRALVPGEFGRTRLYSQIPIWIY